MNLRDAMHKAAGLIVEQTPEPRSPEDDAPELDDVLAQVEQASQGQPPGARKGGASDWFGGAPQPPKTVEQIVREADGPNLDEVKAGAASALASGEVTPAAIYQQANLPAAPFTAEQMLDLLASLPPELLLDTKRQTVKVTLSALGKSAGATPETIVTDASRKLAALNAYIESLAQQADNFAVKAETEITALQAQIEEKRKAIQAARQKVLQGTQICEQESHRLDDVLEFFSLDVPPSKHAPK